MCITDGQATPPPLDVQRSPPRGGGGCRQMTPPAPLGGSDTTAEQTLTSAYCAEFMARQLPCCRSPKALGYTPTCIDADGVMHIRNVKSNPPVPTNCATLCLAVDYFFRESRKRSCRLALNFLTLPNTHTFLNLLLVPQTQCLLITPVQAVSLGMDGGDTPLCNVYNFWYAEVQLGREGGSGITFRDPIRHRLKMQRFPLQQRKQLPTLPSGPTYYADS